MSAVGPNAEKELVVADDGSIPAEQLARLGLRPGAHLRVVEAVAGEPGELEGSLPNLPDLGLGRLRAGQRTSAARPQRRVRVVADSHAIFWHLQRSPKLSAPAAQALRKAGTHEIVVSVATLATFGT